MLYQLVLINALLCYANIHTHNTSIKATWPHLKHCVNRPNSSSWPTLMGRERKRRTIRRQTPYRISVLQFVLICIRQCSVVFSKNRCVHKIGEASYFCISRIYLLSCIITTFFINRSHNYIS